MDKRKSFALERFPEIGLAEARQLAEENKKLVSDGIDPVRAKRNKRQGIQTATEHTLDAVAADWLEAFRNQRIAGGARLRSQKTITKAEWSLSYFLPTLGSRPIADIKPLEILGILREIEKAGKHETAARARARISEVFQLAVITGLRSDNPAALLGKTLAGVNVTHRPAITEPDQIGELLRAIDGYESFDIRIALLLLALTAVRPGEIRHMEWSEIDFNTAIWSIPAEKMKMRQPHRVPLSPQVQSLLKEIGNLTGNHRLVFPGHTHRDRPLSDATLNAALRRMGYDTKTVHCSHGFRSTFASIAHGDPQWRSEIVECALAHKEGGVKGIYQRGDYLEEPRELMNWYADKLDQLGNEHLLEGANNE